MASEAVERLVVKDLVVGYGQSAVLHGVSLSVASGARAAVLGPNGAGKSTLLRTISGLLKPRAGSIELDGRRIDGLEPASIVALGVAHVPEGRQLFPEFTVRENLRVAAYSRGGKGLQHGIDRVLDIFPALRQHLHTPAGLLSGGQQQMVALGRAIVQQPRLVLIDELSLGLAPILVRDIFGRLDDLFAADVSLVLVEQNPRMAIEHSDYVHVMRAGQILEHGRPADFQSQAALARAYLGERLAPE